MGFTKLDSDKKENVGAQVPTIHRAILSVSDKTGLAEFARQLADSGIELLSTGGTRAHLIEHGLQPTDIADYTRFPEIMDGRVKTLHPKVFGGILCRRDNEQDIEVTDELGIDRIDLVVVNLYPFQETIARADITEQMAIENIDIGGPSLVRAAAKNSSFVTIATSPDQYAEILDQIRQFGGTTDQLRRRLMIAAFSHTAQYDQRIASYFAAGQSNDPLPETFHLRADKVSELRYGENAHQPAAVYSITGDSTGCVGSEQLNGKELSFNNYLDLDAALAIVTSFDTPSCCVIKHNNPCGAATGNPLADVCQRAMAGDPVSAFGSIIGFNRDVDPQTAEFLCDGEFFVEAIIAPDFDDQALQMLTSRPKWKKNVRLIRNPAISNHAKLQKRGRMSFRQIRGGLLVQRADDEFPDADQWNTVTDGEIEADTMSDLVFAWLMVRFVKSNAIVLAKDESLVGVGAGQMSRVDSVKIAIEKAGRRSDGSVLASDAFFPFPDSIEIAASAGVKAVIQPGGSVKDAEVIAACRQHDVHLVLTGRRHFLH